MWQKLKARLKGWKTIIWNSGVSAAGVVLLIVDLLKTVDLSPLLGGNPKALAIVAIVVGVSGILLRIATTGRVGEHREC